MELFDSHAHYNDEKFEEDREEVLEEIYKSGVTKLINAGYSVESSKKAIEIAKKNANSNNVNVEFYLGDLFESINVNEKFDLIVSNPPYIETDVIKTLSLDVQKETQKFWLKKQLKF